MRSVLDPNPIDMPPGLYQYCMVISMAQREMKITALTIQKEHHDIWLNVGHLYLGSAHGSDGSSGPQVSFGPSQANHGSVPKPQRKWYGSH
jgi:hypothetical protein